MEENTLEATSEAKTKTLLAKAGIKCTLPRLAIIQLLSQKQPLNATEIFQELRSGDVSCTLGTVYRELSQMKQTGVVRKVKLMDRKACFELANSSRHYHMVNSDSGDIVEFEHKLIEEVSVEVAGKYGCEVSEIQLIIYAKPKSNAAAR